MSTKRRVYFLPIKALAGELSALIHHTARCVFSVSKVFNLQHLRNWLIFPLLLRTRELLCDRGTLTLTQKATLFKNV